MTQPVSESSNDLSAPSHVVAIGASAGGLEALRSFLGAVDPHTDKCFVVAQHLAPGHESLLSELLARAVPLPVEQIVSGTPLEPGRVFITPANHDIVVEHGRLVLAEPDPVRRPAPSIDRLLESVASAVGAKAAAVILSGSGRDGSLGARAIHAGGGKLLVQSPETAAHQGMPHAAIATGLASCIAPPRELAYELLRHLPEIYPEQAVEDPELLGRILQQVRRHADIDLRAYKGSVLQRRIRKRMQVLGLEVMTDYERRLAVAPQEAVALANEVLISVTAFFRDGSAFDALTRQLREMIRSKSPHEELRVWVAGCATGEEAYSMAILIGEVLHELDSSIGLQLFATDVDTQALGKARRGCYSLADLEDTVPATLRERYFETREDLCTVRKGLRRRVTFVQHNLLLNPPFIHLDLICCRNLLIYLGNPARRQLFETLHYGLRPDGLLFLGRAENLPPQQDLFEPVDHRHRIYRRLSTNRRLQPFLSMTRTWLAEEPLGLGEATSAAHARPAVEIDDDPAIAPILAEEVDAAATERVHQLEENLQEAWDHLQSVIAQLETANEELHSTNEELHSANEELETANEELLSANERLRDSNVALSRKTAEVDRVNADLENVLISLDDGLVVVDQDLCIKFYNAACREIFTLDESMLGRNLVNVPSRLLLRDLEEHLRQVVNGGDAVETQLREPRDDGAYRHFLMRIRPYCNQDGVCCGAVLSFYDNTRVREAERQSRESEARLRSILAASPVLTTLKDADGCFLYANKAVAGVLGVDDPDDLRGRHNRDFLTASEAQHAHALDMQALESNERIATDDVLTMSGQRRRVLMERFPILTEEGELDALCVQGVDITDLEQANEQLSVQTKALDAATTGIVISDARDPALPIIYANPAFYRISGYAPDEVIGRNCRFLQGHDTEPSVVQAIRDAIAASQPISVILRNYRKSGAAFWNNLSISPIFDTAGATTHYIGIQDDLTQQIDAELALEANERRLRNAQAFARVSHVEWKQSEPLTIQGGDLLHVLLNQSPGRRLSALAMLRQFPAADRRNLFQAIHDCLSGGREMNLELRLRADGELRWLLLRANVIRADTAGGNRILGLVQDITLRKRVEQALVTARLEAESANRAKSEFLSHMSHELRTPLNAVLGFAQLLEADHEAPLTVQQKEYMRHILSSGWHLLDLISEVLDLTRIEAGNIRINTGPVDLRRLAEESMNAVREEARDRNITVSSDIDLPSLLQLDRTRTRQVLLNLLSNAVKYNREGGRVDIKIRGNAEQCTIVVRDTGIGIPADRMQELFEPFNRLGHEGSNVLGTGIGLVITQRIVEMMNGRLTVDSEPGIGSTFTVRISCGAAGLAEPEPEAIAPDTVPAPAGITRPDQPPLILYVEDNDSNRLLARAVLENRLGCRLLDAGDGLAGIGIAETQRPDLILMDLHLPRMDGFQALRQLRANSVTAGIPVVAVSADAAAETQRRAVDAGFDGYLNKPLDMSELKRMLDRLCE